MLSPLSATTLVYLGGVVASVCWLVALWVFLQAITTTVETGRGGLVLWVVFATVGWPLFVLFAVWAVASGSFRGVSAP